MLNILEINDLQLINNSEEEGLGPCSLKLKKPGN